MSEYGKLWSKVSEIRLELKRLVPTISTNKLAEARVTVRELNELVDYWDALEKEMALCDSETGKR